MTDEELDQAHQSAQHMPKGWLREAVERAVERQRQLPAWARPKLVRREPEPEPIGFVCRCGHPGLGCYCP